MKSCVYHYTVKCIPFHDPKLFASGKDIFISLYVGVSVLFLSEILSLEKNLRFLNARNFSFLVIRIRLCPH